MKKERAKHYDNGKERFDLLPPRVLFEVSKVFTWGCNKYTDRNWEKGMKWGKLFGSTMRHLWRFWSGEELDKESKLPHLAHALANIIMLFGLTHTHKELDDRSKNDTGN